MSGIRTIRRSSNAVCSVPEALPHPARRSREWSVGARIAGRPYLRVIHIAAVCAGAVSIEWGKEQTISVSTARAGRSYHSGILLGA